MSLSRYGNVNWTLYIVQAASLLRYGNVQCTCRCLYLDVEMYIVRQWMWAHFFCKLIGQIRIEFTFRFLRQFKLESV